MSAKTNCKRTRAPKQPRECACHIDFSRTEKEQKAQWKKQPGSFDPFFLDLDIPFWEPLGTCYFYPAFEFTPLGPSSPFSDSNFNRDVTRFLALYLSITDSNGQPFPMAQLPLPTVTKPTSRFQKNIPLLMRPNPALSALCTEMCRLRQAHIQRCPSCIPSCEEDFSFGFYTAFSLKLAQTRKPRSNTRSSIWIHDLRLYGHPVTVELQYRDIQTPQQRQRLKALSCCYPGSGKNPVRYSARLGARINEAFAHGIADILIAEGSALSNDVIHHWLQRELRLANRALPKMTARYTLSHCGNFSMVTSLCEINANGISGTHPFHQYRMVCRKEQNHPLRLIGMHRELDWQMVKKLLSGLYDQPDRVGSSVKSICPERLFNVAVDYLSDPDHGLFCREGSASPVLGAMLFLMLYPQDRVLPLLQDNDSDTATFYLDCYHSLARIHKRHGVPPFVVLHIALSLLIGPSERFDPELDAKFDPEFEADVLHWRQTYEALAVNRGLLLPRCCGAPCLLTPEEVQLLPELQSHWFKDLDAFEPTSFRDLFTRILLLNPATLSEIRGGTRGQARFTRRTLTQENDSLGFRCSLCPDGTFDYRNVIPGIDVTQLQSLLEQGFLKEPRTAPLRRRDATSHPYVHTQQTPHSDE